MLGDELKEKGGQPVDPEEMFDDVDDNYNPDPSDMPEPEIVEKAKEKLPVADETELDDTDSILDSGKEEETVGEIEPEKEENETEEEEPQTVSREEYEALEKKRRGFQSALDKRNRELEQLQTIVSSILGVDIAGDGNGNQGVTTSGEKSINDFMPDGVDYDPFDANDPSTESFKALEKYNAYKEELKNQHTVQKLNEYLTQQKVETQYDVLRETEGLNDDEMKEFKEFIENGNNTVRDLYEFYQFKKNGISSIVKKETDKVFDKIEKNSKKVKSIGGKTQTVEPGLDEDLVALNEVFGD